MLNGWIKTFFKHLLMIRVVDFDNRNVMTWKLDQKINL